MVMLLHTVSAGWLIVVPVTTAVCALMLAPFFHKPGGAVAGVLLVLGLGFGATRIYSYSKRCKEEKEKEKERLLMHEELLRVWDTDAKRLPICVDVPRLARRICIVGADGQVCFEPAASTDYKSHLFDPHPHPSDEALFHRQRLCMLRDLIMNLATNLPNAPGNLPPSPK